VRDFGVYLVLEVRDTFDDLIVRWIVGLNVELMNTLEKKLSVFYYIPSLVINTRRAVGRTSVS